MHSLSRLLRPDHVALLGLTINPKSVGAKALANLLAGGFEGTVHPVNATNRSIMSVPCYPDLESLPHTPDLALICAEAARVPGLVRDCGEAGIPGIAILSAGFGETGESGQTLEHELARIIGDFPGMRVLGPNCLGLIAPGRGLNASFACDMPRSGSIAFISQSGALGTALLDWAQERNIGLSYFVSIGNTVDVGFAELIDYLGEDYETKAIILYVESIKCARKFMSAARAFALTKPIIVYKAGRFAESAGAVASHTGALASDDDAYDAAFQRAGLVRVFDINDVFDCAEILSRRRMPAGPRLAIVTNAGGPGVIATDTLIASDGRLALLSTDTKDALDQFLPPCRSQGNPVDVLGDAPSRRISKATRLVLQDPGVDAVLVILTPQAMTDPSGVAKAIGKINADTSKPVLAAWLGGTRMRNGIHILNDAGVAAYTMPEQAVRAFMTLVRYTKNLESLYETPSDIRMEVTRDREDLSTRAGSALSGGRKCLSEIESKAVLAAYGISVSAPRHAATPGKAVRIAKGIGFPIVLKVDSADVVHKTDVGGVALNVVDEAGVRRSFACIHDSVAKREPGAKIRGVTVQPMISADNSIELIIGIKRDPVFGSLIAVGAGGIAAEIWKEHCLGLPPLNERLVRKMFQSLRVWPLLQGYRGRPRMDLDGLIEAVIRLSHLAIDHPEVTELDVNPLLLSPEGVTALDARVIIDPALRQVSDDRYGHLALRPYPEEYVKRVRLQSGLRVVLRPIKPEDEPLWLALLRSCSAESIYSRFQYLFRWDSHHAAVRYCFNDYDREIAIVAEFEEDGARKLLAVGRIVADPQKKTAEYAVLVGDEWQNKGVGSLLTDFCLEIARDWKVKQVVAQTGTTNQRMISIFRKHGFEIRPDREPSTLRVCKAVD